MALPVIGVASASAWLGGWNSSSSFHWWKFWHCSCWRCWSRPNRWNWLSLGWRMGWDGWFLNLRKRWGSPFGWKTRGILQICKGSFGDVSWEISFDESWIGSKIWKIRKQHWMDWQIHLDSPSYHLFWNFRISHMFTQFLPMRRKWDPLMGLKKRLWSIINHPVFWPRLQETNDLRCCDTAYHKHSYARDR